MSIIQGPGQKPFSLLGRKKTSGKKKTGSVEIPWDTGSNPVGAIPRMG